MLSGGIRTPGSAHRNRLRQMAGLDGIQNDGSRLARVDAELLKE